ncbi:MAG: CBS domain-containing protein [Planctomycetes bacterium]|nr:CBS domain-containing protein [Planctomycetota bacterium]
MLVIDVMTPGLRMIAPDATVRDAALIMDRFDVGSLPVQERDGRLIGIVTDRDIALRATAKGRDPDLIQVRDVMTRQVTCCFADSDAHAAIELMEQLRVRRLPVVDRDNRPIGMIALADIALRVGNHHMTSAVLESVSEPAEV